MTRDQRNAILAVAVPVSLEFIVMFVLTFINQIIVGILGDTAIAAIGFSGTFTFIIMVVFGSLGMSVSILMARGFGAGRPGELSHTLSVALLVGGVLTAAVVLTPVLVPEVILRAVGASDTVAAAGASYLAITACALVPIVLSMILSGAMRSTGFPRSPMIATFMTVPIETALAYCLVLGWGPFPELGMAGAGWALLITSTMKLAILVVQMFAFQRTAAWGLPKGLEHWKEIVVPLIVLALPLAVTEFLWSSGNFLYNVVFQRLGDGPLAAANIALAVEGVFLIGSIGLMSASTALIGKSIGEGDAAEALAWKNRLLRAGLWTAGAFSVGMVFMVFAVPALFPHAGSSVQRIAIFGIVISSIFQWVKVRNMILGGAVLPSGSDVKGVIMGDGIGAFAVGLPLSIVLGLFTPLGVLGVFVARGLEECVKVLIFRYRANKISWSALVELEANKAV